VLAFAKNHALYSSELAISVQPALLQGSSSQPKGAAAARQVCDEGHRLKSAGGNKTIDSLLALRASRRILLTGTPLQNNLDEVGAAQALAGRQLHTSSGHRVHARSLRHARAWGAPTCQPSPRAGYPAAKLHDLVGRALPCALLATRPARQSTLSQGAGCRQRPNLASSRAAQRQALRHSIHIRARGERVRLLVRLGVAPAHSTWGGTWLAA